jgi:tRNA G46 methylase TrmB
MCSCSHHLQFQVQLFQNENWSPAFKSHHWFICLAGSGEERRVLLEVGCGVGNFVFPLLGNLASYQLGGGGVGLPI